MTVVAIGPRKVTLPLYCGEDWRIDFEVAELLDLLDDDDISAISVISVRILDPGGTTYPYTGVVDDATTGRFHVNGTGTNHSAIGTASGRVLFDGVTQPDSEFEIYFRSAY